MSLTGRAGSRVLTRLAALAAFAALAACASHSKTPPAAPIPPPSASAQPPGRYMAEPPEGEVSRGPLPGTEQDFVINVGDRVYFDFSQAQIRPDAEPVLVGQALWLERYPDVRVRIEGNCDERGTREYNFALGARRADAVREFLIDHGVNGGRITTISYGKERPTDPGHDEQAWAKTRNAHTAVVSGARS
jgi:peptidoglycan-associated lipoprotein